jgi:glycerate 2-kinase
VKEGRGADMEKGRDNSLHGKGEGDRLQRMREIAMDIFRAGLQAVDPEEAVYRKVTLEDGKLRVGERVFDLGGFKRVLVVGAGKASAPMAKALEAILRDRIEGGSLVVKEGHGLALGKISVEEASHPVPDMRGVKGTQRIMDLLSSAGQEDLVIGLISGGGSALLVAPVQGITLKDKQEVTRLLLSCGATIHEVNTVRKHLSAVKGGQLARLAAPATLITLILSDVIGDDLDVIASGPTVPDKSTFLQAKEVLQKYSLWDKVPPAVRGVMDRGVAGKIPDTPKDGDPCFQRCHWEIVGSNLQALMAAREFSESLGYRSMILTSRLEGEAREVAKALVSIAKEVKATGNPIGVPCCILSGGETVVTLRGKGKGGRNMELALSASMALDGMEDLVFLSAGTDGTDGPTDAAGAIADGTTIARARRLGLSPLRYLDENDSYHFFEALGDLVITGPTRTNVMDIQVILVE